MKNKIIQFLRQKDFKYIDEIGQGGTGRTVLLEDELIDERFVCKKYSPYYKEDQEIYFENFKQEIKILHLLNNKNIVRVFNYYLYPESFTGYIMMEHVIGDNIVDFIKVSPHLLEDIFVQTINGFLHLEENGVLHRDIRPDNILVSHDGIVKLIDFGFGKRIKFEADFDKSVSLNWRYSLPKDFEKGVYDYSTEIYFLGKLFEEIIIDTGIKEFKHEDILNQMIKDKPEDRINSFFDINRSIISNVSNTVYFTDEEKSIYRQFCDSFEKAITKVEFLIPYRSDIDQMIMDLEEIERNSILEYFVQRNSKIGKCFFKGNFYFSKSKDIIHVYVLSNFIKFFKALSKNHRTLVLNNMWQRFDSIDRYHEHTTVNEDNLPF